MEIKIFDDYNKLSEEAAKIIVDRVKRKPNLILGLATGSTPLGMYEQLINFYREKRVSFSKVVTFNLDEYYPISKDNPQSYHYFMWENFWSKVDLKIENVNIPNGNPTDVLQECREYEQKIKEAGEIDLQVLGIGENGHIGFNEPASSLSVNTHLVDLTEDTINVNSRFFNNPDEVPKQAITMGIGTIMKAKEIILLASGDKKANAIKETLNGTINTRVPASILQAHPRVTVILDKEAAKYI
jgi:glucosamine-6-phosphate deaminase